MKNNLSYYRHEVTSHNHWKFKLLRKQYGWEGEGKFWALNNEIAASENCTLNLMDEGRKISLAIDLDFNEEDFDTYITFLATKCRLICIDNGCITTEITQENLEEVSKDRERKREWIRQHREQQQQGSRPDVDGQEPPQDADTSNVDVYNPDVDVENQQSKGKESKVKESNTIDSNESTETGVSVPSPELELRRLYKVIATGTSEQVEQFIKDHSPHFMEPYARAWNFLAVEKGFSKVQALTDPRKQKIKTRTHEKEFDFLTILRKARDSTYLVGQAWFTFDWIIENQTNYVKVLEGNYDNKKQSSSNQQTTANEILKKREQQKAKLSARL